MEVKFVEGDLLEQTTDSVVNPWNRNVIPWWLLIPSGVSGAIKRRSGLQPFVELGKLGPIPLGGAVATSAGNLPFKCLIHVASINMVWSASEHSIRKSVFSAMKLAEQLGVGSVAFPVLGAGSGGYDAKRAESIMIAAFNEIESAIEVTVVRFKKQ